MLSDPLRCPPLHRLSLNWLHVIYIHITDLINVHVGVQDSVLRLIDDFESIVLLRRGYVYALLLRWVLLEMTVWFYGRLEMIQNFFKITIIIKVQFDQLHLFTIVIFDNCCIAYISFALQFRQISPTPIGLEGKSARVYWLLRLTWLPVNMWEVRNLRLWASHWGFLNWGFSN